MPKKKRENMRCQEWFKCPSSNSPFNSSHPERYKCNTISTPFNRYSSHQGVWLPVINQPTSTVERTKTEWEELLQVLGIVLIIAVIVLPYIVLGLTLGTKNKDAHISCAIQENK